MHRDCTGTEHDRTSLSGHTHIHAEEDTKPHDFVQLQVI